MKIPSVYIETSVFNFFFADDAPDKRADTRKLFAEIGEGKYIPFTSQYVVRELERCEEPKRGEMLELIPKYGITALRINDEVDQLGDMYIVEGIIPEKHHLDALHIAMATVYGLDFIVSFNFKHIVKRKTVTMTESINLREGYRRLGIFSPTEVIENV